MHCCANQTLPVLAAALLSAGLLVAPSSAQATVRTEAFRGEPFGVGRLAINVPAGLLPEVLGVDGLGLTENSGRALYPAIEKTPLRATLRDLLNLPQRVTVYFLFVGDRPLELTLQSRRTQNHVVPVRRDPGAHARLLTAWWRAYTAEPGPLQKKPEYPPIIENYLRSMLAGRLKLPLGETKEEQTWQKKLQRELGLVLGAEAIHLAMQRDRMLGRTALGEVADRPPPEPIKPPAMVVPGTARRVVPPERLNVEPIAMRVPNECLYIRFRSVSNFLWFRNTLERWKSDARNLLVSRGLDYQLIKRTEDQLCLRQSGLTGLLGDAAGMLSDTVVADVALVGTDRFQHEGAAMGVLFQARNNLLLAAEILRQRLEAVQPGDAVTEQKVTVAGRKVSFLSSPGNAVRSFYVADGDFHFVTTSKTLARRFLETRAGAGSLGASKEFRHARSVMPAARNDTAFIYLSDAFFRNLVSPHYRVEMVRRLQAVADCSLVQMAVLASATEGKPGATIEQLKAGGFLPPEFGPRGDGSRTVLEEGRVYDSLRGRRGTFLPVPDVEVARVTPSEAAAYERFREYYHAQWGRVDPIMLAIKRHPLKNNRERIVLDLRMSPLAKTHYQRLARLLGPADTKRLAAVPGDVAAGELLLPGGRLFAGVRNVAPAFQIAGQQVVPIGKPADMLFGYVGTIGELGLLNFLDVLIRAPADKAGYAGIEGIIWRRQWDRFTVFSFQRETLATVTPQLRMVGAKRPAQVRLHVGDLSQGRPAPWLNVLGYIRSRETSLGNLRLMHSLQQQLCVPSPDCKVAAELLLGAKLICPLEGKYIYRQPRNEVGRWTSTALDAGGGPGWLTAQIPEGYQAPPLNWFRGLDLDACLTQKDISGHAEVLMQLPAKD